MDRSTYSTTRPKHLEQNLNRFDTATHKKKPTSASQEKATQPTLRNITENNRKIIYPSIQLQEYKNSIIRHDDDSSIVESSFGSDEELNSAFKSSTSEITLCSRPSSVQKKNGVEPSEGRSIHYFEYMHEDVIRKILFEHFIDFNDIPTTAKNLMHFASISKFNRQFVKGLLKEEVLHEVSYEITKSAIPDLLSNIVDDKKEKFTISTIPDLLAMFVKGKKQNIAQKNIDSLVREWPYLTVDCSHKKNLYSDRGLETLEEIMLHPDLKGLRIINNIPDKIDGMGHEYFKQNDKNLNLIYSLLLRESKDSLKIDINFKNWVTPIAPVITIFDEYFEPIKKVQAISTKRINLSFGELNLSRNIEISLYLFHENQMTWADFHRKYQSQFVKMMCNIAVSHSAHTISLAGLKIFDEDLALIVNEIKECNKSNLKHLDLIGNDIDESAAKSLSELLQSKNTSLKTLHLNRSDISHVGLNIFALALKNNHSLELVEIINGSNLKADHPIRNDKRVRLT
jgi:hypothetical protein